MTRTYPEITPGEATTLGGLDAEDAMAILGRSLAEAVRAAPEAPSRAVVRFGCASIEVEWPVGTRVVEGVARPEPAAEPAEDLAAVVAPVVGTFYRAPEPGARPFVEAGDEIEAGTQVGIVEAMKLMNPILAETAGVVAEVVAGDAESVEYGQPLLLVRPRAEG
ncbi:acetyl-CoA carboxylase biotin carboxyl carrier protein [Amycolatopsis eburnea]|uniref:Biotin carboxyl carrier protein of acetyl-CoA carboxylase n=1 Tax=Amycolatopsis eburnea TaxID=2267691 RepID=A0A427TAK2_9PSEU|nr:biotin/lipoyl-containing protein [Amycolatopsis eburnea]RSD19442.1 acetyl-CoA carboxylase biotin carboxyl carrier protein subunit [Amycolatopsis eburnea]